MSDRPTLETDAETMRDEYNHTDSDFGPFAPSDTVPADFARRLERERDEAREDATNYCARIGELEKERDEARAQVENQKARIGELFSALEKLTAERDEARARVELIKPHENNPVAEFFSSSNTPETDAIYKFLRERITFEKCDTQVWMEHAQQIERERDGAREVLREIAEASGFDNIGNWARNKARKALEALKTK